MNSNSTIISTTVLGTGSGLTREELNQKNTETVESFIFEQKVSKLNNRMPQIPSNQKNTKR